mgnify:CR=1 FL=1
MITTFVLNAPPDEEYRGNLLDMSFVLDSDSHWYTRYLLPKADALYFPPGDSPALIEGLKAIKLTAKDVEGKLVLAYSAGVSALTTHSFNFDHIHLVDGLGIIPFCSIVHYTPAKDWAADYLCLKFGLDVLKVDDSHKCILRMENGRVMRQEWIELPKPQAVSPLYAYNDGHGLGLPTPQQE